LLLVERSSLKEMFMKLQLIAAAIGSTVLAFGAFAQSATESGSGTTGSGSSASAPSSSCESLSGEEKTRCLQDEATRQAPASSGGESSGASGGTSGGSEPSPSDSTPASKSE